MFLDAVRDAFIFTAFLFGFPVALWVAGEAGSKVIRWSGRVIRGRRMVRRRRRRCHG